MEIAVIGGTGMVGSAITTEAINRNHQVTVITRNQDKANKIFTNQVNYLEADAFNLTIDQLNQFDVIIDAYAPAQGEDVNNHLKLAEYLMNLLKNTNRPRIGFVLGSSSLINPETNDYIAKKLKIVPSNRSQYWVPTALAQFDEYLFLQSITDVNWFGFSPQPMFTRGNKTEYEIGTDQPLNEGSLSTGNAAAAIIDEIEVQQFLQKRFTAANIDHTDWSKVDFN